MLKYGTIYSLSGITVNFNSIHLHTHAVAMQRD